MRSLSLSLRAAGVAEVSDEVRQLSLGGASARGQRRGALRYIGLNTRPENVASVHGECSFQSVVTDI